MALELRIVMPAHRADDGQSCAKGRWKDNLRVRVQSTCAPSAQRNALSARNAGPNNKSTRYLAAATPLLIDLLQKYNYLQT